MTRTDAVETLALLGGAADHAQLVRHGCSRSSLRGAVAAGLVLLVARGRYCLPTAVDPRRSAVRVQGLASHTSAALHWGIAVARAPQRSQVTVSRTRSRVASRGIQVHWSDVPPEDAGDHVTEPRRTVLDCARTLPFGEGLAVADSALRDRLVDAADLRHHAGLLRGPGAASARRVASAADGLAANPFESVLRGLALDAGLDVRPQVAIAHEDFFARVDLADVGRRLVLEADSFTFHGHREALARDCRRYDELVLLGWRVLRFAWDHVMHDPDWVTDVLLRAAGAPWLAPHRHARPALTA